MPDLNYNVENNEAEMQFEIEDGGEKAYLTYKFHKKNIAFMHTVVPEALMGKGMGSALAIAAFDYAKSHKKLVMVYCPFVASFLKKNVAYKQQLDPEYYKA